MEPKEYKYWKNKFDNLLKENSDRERMEKLSQLGSDPGLEQNKLRQQSRTNQQVSPEQQLKLLFPGLNVKKDESHFNEDEAFIVSHSKTPYEIAVDHDTRNGTWYMILSLGQNVIVNSDLVDAKSPREALQVLTKLLNNQILELSTTMKLYSSNL